MGVQVVVETGYNWIMKSKQTRFLGIPCKKMAPALTHRPAIWENMLGTVYALNDLGECQYFDYDYDAAKAFAGIADDRDVRIARAPRGLSWIQKGCTEANPRRGKLVLWVKRV